MGYSIVKIKDIISFNPKESLAKGTPCKKIAMEFLSPFTRKIAGFEKSRFSGGTKFRNNDVIMARITPCLENGKTAKVTILDKGEVAFGSTEFIVLRAIPGQSDPDFVYYLATCQIFREVAIKSMVGTTGRQRVQQNVLEELELMLPDYTLQKKIGRFLSSIDDKIELNTQINHNLEEQAKAIFKSWFVDFEPFQNGKFVDSELGPIPDGWSCISFEDFLQPRNEKSNDNTLQMYAVTDHGIIKRENKFHKKLSKSETKNKVLYVGDLVFGMSREILNWGIMHDAVGGVSSAYNIYEITNGIDPLFIEFYMHSNQVYFKDLIRPATREGQGVDKSALVRKKLIYPPVHIWNNIKQMLSSFAEKNESINNEITDLIELRDTLLPKLMSGEIDVSEVEI